MFYSLNYIHAFFYKKVVYKKVLIKKAKSEEKVLRKFINNLHNFHKLKATENPEKRSNIKDLFSTG